MDGAQLGQGLIERDSGSKAAEQIRHAMHAARNHGGGEVVRAGDDVSNDSSIRRIRNGGLEDADDRGSARVKALQADLFANNGRIFLENRAPKRICENHDAGGLGTVVLGSDEPAEYGMKAHDFKIVASHDASLNFARLT